MRWNEEFQLACSEMEWTARFYISQGTIWQQRKEIALEREDYGAAAYAFKKVAMWEDIKMSAEKMFSQVNPNYTFVC
jgi:hypothetical protein